MVIIAPEFPNPEPFDENILPIALELGDGDFLELPDEHIQEVELNFFDELSDDDEDYIPNDDETESTLEYDDDDMLSDMNLYDTVLYDADTQDWDLDRELGEDELLYANNIVNYQPGRESLEKWLRITLFLSPHSNNRYNLDRTTPETVQIILINQVWGFWEEQDNLMIMCRELMRQYNWTFLELIHEYSMAYNFYKLYMEEHGLEA